MKILTTINKMIVTEQDELDFANATQCDICGGEIKPMQSEGSLSYNW